MNLASQPEGLGKTCAVVVTYEIGSKIFDCVGSVIDQVDEIVIVDNGSGSSTVAALRNLELRSGVKIIYNPDNLGIACALNQGIEYAIEHGYRWILTLDHDSEATPGMVKKLLQGFLELGDRVGIVAARPFDRDTRRFVGIDLDQKEPYAFAKMPVISSGNLIDVGVFERIGFFNENLFVYYVDNEFCLRLLRNGLQIAVCCDAILLHSEGHKTPKRFLWKWVLYDQTSAKAKYYIARNGIFMVLKYPRAMSFGYEHSRRVISDLFKIFLYDEQPWQKAGYVLRGIRDGIRGRYGALTAHGSYSVARVN